MIGIRTLFSHGISLIAIKYSALSQSREKCAKYVLSSMYFQVCTFKYVLSCKLFQKYLFFPSTVQKSKYSKNYSFWSVIDWTTCVQ